MSGTKLLADTNILIYFLEGNPQYEILADEVSAISVISEIEMLGHTGISTDQAKIIREFLDSFEIFELTPGIKEIAISLKQRQRLKLPDAVIAATAIYHDLVLFISDRDFKKIKGLNLMLVEN